jgi:hypothetical protein
MTVVILLAGTQYMTSRRPKGKRETFHYAEAVVGGYDLLLRQTARHNRQAPYPHRLGGGGALGRGVGWEA